MAFDIRSWTMNSGQCWRFDCMFITLHTRYRGDVMIYAYALRHSLSRGLSLNMASVAFTYWAWLACINCTMPASQYSLLMVHWGKWGNQLLNPPSRPLILLVWGTLRLFLTVESRNRSKGSFGSNCNKTERYVFYSNRPLRYGKLLVLVLKWKQNVAQLKFDE